MLFGNKGKSPSKETLIYYIILGQEQNSKSKSQSSGKVSLQTLNRRVYELDFGDI